MGKLVRYLAAGLILLCLTGCAVQTGWITEDGRTIYADENGNPVTGWQEIDGSKYFFSPDGSLATGWITENTKTYFLLESGVPVTGWMPSDAGQRYFFSDGVMAQGWAEIDGIRHYFGSDGLMATGRVELEDGVYLLDGQGQPLTGWQTTESGPIYCESDGAVAVGWTEIDGHRYYFGADGIMLTGHLELEDGRYLLNEDGTAYTGWLTEDDKQYYYKEDGSMAIGPAEIDGETFYFSPHGVHILLVNPWNYVPEGYTVELKTVEYYSIATQCADALKQMLADCRSAGFDPAICSTYRTQEDQEFLYNRKVKRVMALGYGEEEARVLAAQEVAIPGTSEHQLGLAVDIVDNAYWELDEKQAQRPTQKWLMEHCWEYGFILRYPVGSTEITGIIYEPWHYRYVGVEISMELRELGITLEEYLGASDHGSIE